MSCLYHPSLLLHSGLYNVYRSGMCQASHASMTQRDYELVQSIKSSVNQARSSFDASPSGPQTPCQSCNAMATEVTRNYS